MRYNECLSNNVKLNETLDNNIQTVHDMAFPFDSENAIPGKVSKRARLFQSLETDKKYLLYSEGLEVCFPLNHYILPRQSPGFPLSTQISVDPLSSQN